MAAEIRRRCAVYTRKSTEEGLEQAFNSLDAQREACSAYVMSQCHEGWDLLPDLYDDGGYSGGNMDRPGLRHLLTDIAAGRIDVVVVYKVDRLTRSLADFAKIVEILEASGASFVSVTQAFNTTTRMGRLTLNVLLSFAQFEREVTGERIRDKIAASKARGIRSRARISRNGKHYGDAPFNRGALYLMLRNRLYLGEIVHQGKAYPGEHDAVVEADLFDRVGALLDQNRNDHWNGAHADEPSLLVGKVWDGLGRRMSPDHATRRSRRYRYYASRLVGAGEKAWRVPAGDLEGLVLSQMCLLQGDEPTSSSEHRQRIATEVERIDVHADRIDIRFADDREVSVPASIIRRGKETRLAIAPHIEQPARRDPALIRLLIKAHLARQLVENSVDLSIAELASQSGYTRDYFGVLLRIAYLAPDIVTAILEGRQPAGLNRQRLARATNIPIDWQAQREMLGFA